MQDDNKYKPNEIITLFFPTSYLSSTGNQALSSSLLLSPSSSISPTVLTQPSAPPLVPPEQALQVTYPTTTAKGDATIVGSPLKMDIYRKKDVEEEMDTQPVVEKPSVKSDDPFAGLLADMKNSIQKAPSFKSPKRTADSSGDEGPRTDRAQTFPQIEDAVDRHQKRSGSLGNEEIKTLSSRNVNSNGNSDEIADEEEEEEDDDATQLTGEFEYTQSGSPTF